MFRKTVVILVSGKAGSGKSTTASILQKLFTELGLSVKPTRFALGVKQIARLLGWDGLKDFRGRQLLIDIGMAGRKYNKDIWVDMIFDKCLPALKEYPFDVILIDDWRFPNEYRYIKNTGFYSVYTVRVNSTVRGGLDNPSQSTDLSEISLDNFDFHFVINNSFSLEDLEKECVKLLNTILEKEN